MKQTGPVPDRFGGPFCELGLPDMPLLFVMIILSAPLIELWLLIEIGVEIGGFVTIVLCLATAAAGFRLIRTQGFDLAKKVEAKSKANEPVGPEMLEAIGLALAGLFLLFPGFLSDAVGFLLLIPPVRGAAAARIAQRQSRFFAAGFGTAHSYQPSKDGPIIEGETVSSPDPELKPGPKPETIARDTENLPPPPQNEDSGPLS